MLNELGLGSGESSVYLILLVLVLFIILRFIKRMVMRTIGLVFIIAIAIYWFTNQNV